MTTDEYLDALRAAAHAGDRKAAAFLDRYASRLVELPSLPSLSNVAATSHPAIGQYNMANFCCALIRG
ncbi:hypothetical protein FNZ56_04250 [Pseudoluteimonas lycopersici]|uniref:Uncharacterized protein n=1 Tax=Pseudoluteimonas lycopersici TaxID=1324796 RepID=A0A516V3N4_9GAMM|nr:hypothetical protein [Lysobacter lycopersici]QDQ73141.1 hypothetical protein FNZ56_04250 [Lysobacter lycopersici]